MFSLFRKHKEREESSFEEYERLVKFETDPGSFLDVDTTRVMDLRDDINDEISAGNSTINIQDLEEVDRLFQNRVKSELAHDLNTLQGDPKADYVIFVLLTLADFAANEPISKWWYHVVTRDMLPANVKNK